MRRRRSPLRKVSLRVQITITFLAVTLLLSALLAFFYIQATRQALLGQANQVLYAGASRAANSLDLFISTNLEAIRTQSGLPTVVAYMNLPPEKRSGSVEEEMMLSTLSVLRNENLYYISSYAILDETGRNILDVTSPDIGQDESNHDYFRVPMITGRPFVSSVEFAPDVGGVYFYFSNPVRNDLGQIKGVMRVRYSVALLQELVAQTRGMAGDDSYAILLDENGMRLSQDAAPELIFRSIKLYDPMILSELRAVNRLPNLLDSELTTDLPAFAEGVANEDETPYFVAEELIEGGRTEQMAVVSLETVPWQVVYAQPQQDFLDPIEGAIQVILLWTAIVIGLLVMAAIVVAHWLTEPVDYLTAVARQITAGDLTARAQVESEDEIGQLAVAFNAMTTQLQATLVGLEKREEALQSSNEQLENALQELQDAQAQMVQQERIAAVGQLAAGVAHDFNNIMGTVILYSDLMLKASDLSPKDHKRLSLIRQQGQRAADLTQQILDFSRKSIMRWERLDLWLFLQEIEMLLSRTMPENIRLSVTRQTDNDAVINADPTRLQQAVLNLAINARNAMEAGGSLKIELTAVTIQHENDDSELEPGNWLCLSISDTGIGIPDEVLVHMFEPFFTTRAPLGSGLGLSQVDGIIKQHGGHIIVKTEVDKGTTFDIYLPAIPGVASKTVPTTAVASLDDLEKGNGEQILLVEDDNLTRQALTNALEILNYKVITAVNGREALQYYQQESDKITLVISDLVMPEMGGKELLQQLHQQNPALKSIVITGYPPSGQENELRSLGAVSWCQKPVDLIQLSQMVSQALSTD